MEMTRRGFITTVSAGGATVPLARKAFAQAKLKMKIGYMKIVDLVPFFIAMEKGYFREEGLDVEAMPFVAGAAIVPAVAAGDLQIGWAGTTPLNRVRDSGLDFKYLVGGAFSEQWLYDSDALMISAASPIRAPKDMAGKKVAVPTLYSMNHLLMIAYLVQHGTSPDRVSFVEVPFPQMEGALKANRIDAMSIHEPFVTAAVLRGGAHVIAHNWSEVVPRFMIASFCASEKWIKANKEAAQAFIKAHDRGTDYANGNLGEVRSVILPKYTGLPADLAPRVVMPSWEKKLLLSDLRPVSELSHQHKFTKRKVTAEEQVSDLAMMG